MNASRFMDKQIMDLINPQSDQQPQDNTTNINGGLNKNNEDILPNYDFQPINRSTDHNSIFNSTTRGWASVDDPVKPVSSPRRSYSSLDHVEPDKIVLEKAEKVNDSAVLSEIDRTMKKHTDALMHAIDSLSARLSQMESRTRQVEHSVDDLKVTVGNSHGSTDGKLRQLENILLEVKTGVQNLKDKQEVFEGHMLLAKLQTSTSEQSPELPNSAHQVPVQQATATAPPQQSGFQQFPTPSPQPLTSMAPPPSQPNIHPPPPMTCQFSLTATPPGPHRDPYFQPPTQTPDVSSQQFQIPPSVTPPAPHPQQYQQAPTPPYPQPPQPPQQQHPSVIGGNAPPQFQPSLGPVGHRPDDSPYGPPPTYTPNHYQPASQPGSGPPHYGSPSLMYEPPPPPARSGSGFQSSYVPPSGSSDSFSYGGPTSHYGGAPSVKQQPHSPRGGTNSYPQLPTARVLPQAIPTASGVGGGGGSSSGGSGNKVPIDDVVDKVTTMGFSRDQVRATVRRLTENGQSVDLNIVLDKLMNDVDVQPPKGWFGR